MKALTKIDLDIIFSGGCSNPECQDKNCKSGEPLFLVAGCHPSKGLEMEYYKAEGALHVRCLICEKPVAVIAVDKGI